MRLWRISNYLELNGAGGFHADGRWHSAGRAIVYTAESSALALLEALVHFEQAALPADYQLLQMEVEDGVSQEHHPSETVPEESTRSVSWGNDWLESQRSALLSVPAAVAPFSRNWLINPKHRDAAGIRLVAHGRWPWDKRLFRSG